MEKEELIQLLEYSRAKAMELDVASARYEAKKRELEALLRAPEEEPLPEWHFSKWLFGGILCLLLVGVIALLITPSIRGLLAQDRRMAIAISLVLLIASGLLAWSIESSIGSFLEGKWQEKTIARNQESYKRWEREKRFKEISLEHELARYQDERDAVTRELGACTGPCGLHYRYQNETALAYLIHYLRTGRCDTLKEALNLYEAEVARYWRAQQETQYRQWMEQTVRNEFDKLKKELGQNAEASHQTAAQILDNTASIMKAVDQPDLPVLPTAAEAKSEQAGAKRRRLLGRRRKSTENT